MSVIHINEYEYEIYIGVVSTAMIHYDRLTKPSKVKLTLRTHTPYYKIAVWFAESIIKVAG